MFKSIADVFNSPEAIYNDPLYKIHNTVQPCNAPPETEEYIELLDNFDPNVYPTPTNKIVHHRVNPLYGIIKPLPHNKVIKIIL